MAHFEALGLHFKKTVVALPKCGAIRVKIAFTLGCLKNACVFCSLLFSTSLKSKMLCEQGKTASLHQQLIVSLKIPLKSSFNAQVSLLTAHARSIEATLAILLLQSSFFL